LEPRKVFSFFLLALLFLIFLFFIFYFFGLAQLDPFFSPKNVDWIFYHFFPPLLPSISSATAMVRHSIRPFPIIDPAVVFINFSTA
jgi:hypothetical protein